MWQTPSKWGKNRVGKRIRTFFSYQSERKGADYSIVNGEVCDYFRKKSQNRDSFSHLANLRGYPSVNHVTKQQQTFTQLTLTDCVLIHNNYKMKRNVTKAVIKQSWWQGLSLLKKKKVVQPLIPTIYDHMRTEKSASTSNSGVDVGIYRIGMDKQKHWVFRQCCYSTKCKIQSSNLNN